MPTNAVPMTQINTRIPLELKTQGDEVLAQKGKTASDVIRMVWTYMAQYQEVPELEKKRTAKVSSAQNQHDAVRQASTLLKDFRKKLNISESPDVETDYRALRDEWAEERLEAYGALDD